MNDAVEGLLIEPMATEKTGEPTGNLTKDDMDHINKKKFKLNDVTSAFKLSMKEKPAVKFS